MWIAAGLIWCVSAFAAPRVALPAGTDPAGWRDAAAQTGVEITATDGDVRVTATSGMWIVEVVPAGPSATVPPPRTASEREAVLVLAASLARPLATSAPRSPPASPPVPRPRSRGGVVPARPPAGVTIPAAEDAPPSIDIPLDAVTPSPAAASDVAAPAAEPTPASDVAVPPPEETPTGAAEAPPRWRWYPSIAGGGAASLDWRAASTAAVGLGVSPRPGLRASLWVSYATPAPIAVTGGAVRRGGASLAIEAGDRWFGRAALGMTLASFERGGDVESRVAWPMIDAGLGYAFAVGPVTLAPQLGARADLASTTVAVGDEVVGKLSPLWGTLAVEIRPSLR